MTVPIHPAAIPTQTMPMSITEVLAEPGHVQVWVTFDDGFTHRLDLRPLLTLESHQSLRLESIFSRVKRSADHQSIQWPGGAHLPIRDLIGPGERPTRTLAVTPAGQRYRPLLPYLVHQFPHTYLRPAPIEAVVIERTLQLRRGELNGILSSLPVPPEILLSRLYDLGTFLTGHFDQTHLYALMRRPWRYGQQRAPHQPLLHTMIGCLQRGRPDLIERPCLIIATGAEL